MMFQWFCAALVTAVRSGEDAHSCRMAGVGYPDTYTFSGMLIRG